MGRELQEILHSAVQLPERDRATLAGMLLASLEPERELGVEAAWGLELRRRIDEVESGQVELIPWEAVRRELFASRHED